jgi:eukaryotic-like serine/threonine-protein kinase
MAEVYLAHDNVLDRDVALKVMSGRYASDEEFVERFKREAQSAAALSHPHIVSIYDRGEDESGTYYIAMEYLPGGTLKDHILKRGALPARTAAEVALQIAEALQVAHKSGVVHRDIKPHNILITDSGDVKVTDFGIARAASSSTMTKTGSILGTAHYISPEQAMGESVGTASDLYSLGVVLYEMLTGTLPYDADTPIGIAMKHVNGHLRPPIEIDPSIPAGINAVTVRLLQKDPRDRYATDAELIEDLERVCAGLEPTVATTEVMTRVIPVPPPARANTVPTRAVTPPAGRGERGGRWRAVPVILLALIMLTLIGYGVYALAGRTPEEPVRVDVPDLEGLTLEEAQDEVGDDFSVRQDDEEDSPQPEGTILDQNPAGGTAESGSVIEVVVASGQNELPDVGGRTRDDAQAAVTEAGFEVEFREEVSEADEEGRVVRQEPEGGSEDLGTTVTLTVGTGPEMTEVPEVVGNTPDQAEDILSEANLEVGETSEEVSDTVPEGSIISQDPEPGTEVEEDSSVNLVVSTGPPQVEVPDVVGEELDVAKQAMLDAGLGYDSVEVESDEPAGTVVETDYPAGTLLDPGTYVLISYSAGPPIVIEPEPEEPAEPEEPEEPEEPDDDGGSGGGGGGANNGGNNNGGNGGGGNNNGGNGGGRGNRN